MKEYRDELIRMAGNPPEVPPNMMLYLKNGKLGVYKNTALDNILKGVLTRVQKIHPEMKFSHHTLRRTAGRAMWKAGAPMETIAEILGHNNTIVTKKYIGVNFDDTQNAMRLMVEYNKKREIGLSSPVAG
jgi:integrase